MSRVFLSPDARFGQSLRMLAEAGLLRKRTTPLEGSALDRNKVKQKEWREKRKAENLEQRRLIEEKRSLGLA